jgi:hypothetical protein
MTAAGRTWVLVLAAALAAVALVLYVCEPSRAPWFPVCLFHQLTGWQCPGCGAARGLHHLLHGRLLDAFRCNPLLMLSLPAFAYGSLRGAWRAWQGLPYEPWPRPGRWAYGLAALLVVYWVVRNLPGFPRPA